MIKWKEISKEEYFNGIFGMDQIQLALQDQYMRNLKLSSVRANLPNGCGLLQYSKEIYNHEYTDDDYDYYKNDGFEYVIYGSKETINGLNRAISSVNINK